MRIAVTGATGSLGGHVVDSLLNKGVAASDIVAIVRNEEKAADLKARGIALGVATFEDEAALTAALEGVDRLVFISGSEVGQRVAQHTNVINAAKAAGVTFIAYTSLLNLDTSKLALAPEHIATEKLLAESGIDHALLRNGWYWENYESSIGAAKATGKVFGAAEGARVSAAARKDYAEAAAVVITSDNQAGKVYELAGAPALTYPEIAAGIGEVIGSEAEYVNLSVEEYQNLLEQAGVPAEFAALLAGMDPIIAEGALYSDSTDLQDLIGRPSTSIVETLSS
ncbi:SDR family oxidoreductase [Corynebacterium glutamicum]|uniref:SDR family oxidoreductase n=1 Tax=Corynebacterium glutamicum TaxID=1718 RepID=UPI00071F90F4|nr:SDR family oxidoreductase [Corynebacterium glutamicum]ALP50076.1 quinone oxidoreductase [Corynebacterium glutamicum]ANU33593.1 NAD(P)-dependent oxidoreductase [Corynebacterium glutamicum]APT07341.1 NAD(P)-dependent oxidoreductase [Corynebacterium glutamicum]WFP70353.1 SDR family oxidoreductase [Corynebacterium glutamicum]BCB32129.1 NAD(P)-dependent oxidoreductase [Corynebacterium glutamicum]